MYSIHKKAVFAAIAALIGLGAAQQTQGMQNQQTQGMRKRPLETPNQPQNEQKRQKLDEKGEATSRIWKAVTEKNAEDFKKAIKDGADYEAKNENGKTLFEVAKETDFSIAEQFISILRFAQIMQALADKSGKDDKPATEDELQQFNSIAHAFAQKMQLTKKDSFNNN